MKFNDKNHVQEIILNLFNYIEFNSILIKLHRVERKIIGNDFGSNR